VHDLGRSELGIWRSAREPARRMSTDSTPAKIGRSMEGIEKYSCTPKSALHDSLEGSSALATLFVVGKVAA